ncbi:FeoA domain-containing protein [Sedimenticola hydrogenitrophicus]|uniref:FeoA domain-containing protein n=1 Tax=Sedimenticola hydrogenitrophicus TaxID=2967975 RepID=UPI0023AFB9A0|nr:FeoA domain-containing protein [Sedimenticola hydrogenitrophicus]
MDTAAVVANPVTLDHIPAGAHACITRIQGDKGLARRLLGLGLRVGSEISVLQQRRRGVVVASAGTRVALGSSVADKLLMQPLDR